MLEKATVVVGQHHSTSDHPTVDVGHPTASFLGISYFVIPTFVCNQPQLTMKLFICSLLAVAISSGKLHLF